MTATLSLPARAGLLFSFLLGRLFTAIGIVSLTVPDRL
jgi:hypothetical protein